MPEYARLIGQARIQRNHLVFDLGCGIATLTLLVKQSHPEATCAVWLKRKRQLCLKKSYAIVASALPPDVRRGLCPAVSWTFKAWATPLVRALPFIKRAKHIVEGARPKPRA